MDVCFLYECVMICMNVCFLYECVMICMNVCDHLYTCVMCCIYVCPFTHVSLLRVFVFQCRCEYCPSSVDLTVFMASSLITRSLSLSCETLVIF